MHLTPCSFTIVIKSDVIVAAADDEEGDIPEAATNKAAVTRNSTSAAIDLSHNGDDNIAKDSGGETGGRKRGRGLDNFRTQRQVIRGV